MAEKFFPRQQLSQRRLSAWHLPRRRSVLRFAAGASLLVATQSLAADESFRAAADSITARELHEHVATLADDVLEGRSVGSRGGYAAGQYIAQQLRASQVVPGGSDGDFFQPCERGGRNILALRPGIDPRLQHEYIVVGAHYDHVGNGSQGHVNGPIGKIYNGADDNASGVAVLLELIEALSVGRVDTKRTILFAFWDGEEVGLVGSKFWFKQPTVPIRAVQMAVNLDMVGRLRDGRLQVLGTRTGYGTRRLFSRPLDQPLWLDFSWELTANSDHWPFVENRIPIAMLHTGLHDDYHRPSDDVEKLSPEGMRSIGRYLLEAVVEIANSDELPGYRPAGRNETFAMQHREQRQLAAQASRSDWPTEPGRPRPRLGIAWRTDDAEPGSVILTRVMANSPAAAAGLAVEDRIYAVNGRPLADANDFRDTVVGLLDADVADFTLLVESRGHVRTVIIQWQPAPLAANAST